MTGYCMASIFYGTMLACTKLRHAFPLNAITHYFFFKALCKERPLNCKWYSYTYMKYSHGYVG